MRSARAESTGASKRYRLPLFALIALLAQPAAALDAADLGRLVGFTIVAYTSVKGEYAGAAAKAPVELENGMAFQLSATFSTYAYRPRAVVFAKSENSPAGNTTTYRLLVENELYEAKRIR